MLDGLFKVTNKMGISQNKNLRFQQICTYKSNSAKLQDSSLSNRADEQTHRPTDTQRKFKN